MGKELIFKALRHEKLDEIPWVPFAGVHAGQLLGYTAEEMLTNADNIVNSLKEVKKLYMPDGLPVIFDLQVEAEILGCELLWAKDNPPSVTTHPLAGEEKTIPCMCQIPTPESGRMPMILDAMKRVKAEIGDEVALYGLICGPFTLASHLRGTDIFMDMMKDKNYVKDLMDFCAQVSIKMCEMYIDAGMDVIAVVDPLISQVSPKMIDKLLADAFKGVFDYIRSKGVFSSFFVCGGIIDLIDSVEDKTNFIVSPGCDMPYATPRENTVACAQAVKNPDQTREMVKNYTSSFDDVEVEMPDYSKQEKVLIELFLLDPDQCAACTYMQASVLDNYEAIKGKAEYRIYKYFIKEDIARTRAMGIKNLPTMCIDGEQKFISIIPSKDELIAAVEEAAAKK